MSQKLINNIINTLTRTVDKLELSESETCLLKAIILLNQEELKGLSSHTAVAVSRLRDRLHGALYHNCISDGSGEGPTIRFAKLLHILPKLTMLARELTDHIQLCYTFHCEQKLISPIFYELFGDIFEEEREHQSQLMAKSMSR
jgi:hypothetical protein